jgi:predicted transcriptional regulator
MFYGMKQILYYLIAGTRGGETRARILKSLKKEPCNAHKLSKRLKLDYKTVQHHLNILEKHQLLTKKGGYGAVYFISEYLEKNWKDFRELV